MISVPKMPFQYQRVSGHEQEDQDRRLSKQCSESCSDDILTKSPYRSCKYSDYVVKSLSLLLLVSVSVLTGFLLGRSYSKLSPQNLLNRTLDQAKILPNIISTVMLTGGFYSRNHRDFLSVQSNICGSALK